MKKWIIALQIVIVLLEAVISVSSISQGKR